MHVPFERNGVGVGHDKVPGLHLVSGDSAASREVLPWSQVSECLLVVDVSGVSASSQSRPGPLARITMIR
jgi:hypothetical protein